MSNSKVRNAKEVISYIKNGDTVGLGGFVGIGFAEEIALEMENSFLEKGTPKDLSLIYAAGQGDGAGRGLNHFGHIGMVRKVIGGHWGLAPKLQKLAIENKIEAYNLPQGVLCHMYRDIAAKKPRTITHVGLGTFVDPRNDGGKINDLTKEDIVELIEFDGQEYLAYKNSKIDVAVIRGTTADEDGNVTFEKEALFLESLELATAVRNSGGIIIVQVERIARRGSLKAKDVVVPGIMVDYIVIGSPENHWQTFEQVYNPAFSGEVKVPTDSIEPMDLGARKVIARRAAFELSKDDVVNLGIGMPEGIANIANEENIEIYFTLTAEPGVIGGIPAGGLNFGASTNTEAVIGQPSQFDFYHGGGLDITFLGLAQADEKGNLNVSKFGTKLAGSGGFIDISQNAKTVVYVGTFTTGGLKVVVENGGINILNEGKVVKFRKHVEHVTFSGEYAMKMGQKVLYITERCVFQLTSDGMELIEIAPGVDIENDIINNMDFEPIVKEPILMDSSIFKNELMGLKINF